MTLAAFAWGASTRQGRQVDHRGVYLNDYTEHLLPWTQEKFEKAGRTVNTFALISQVSKFLAGIYAMLMTHRSEYGFAKYPTAYGRVLNLTRRLTNEYDAVFAKYDAIVMSTVSQPARRHIPSPAGPLKWSHNSRTSHLFLHGKSEILTN